MLSHAQPLDDPDELPPDTVLLGGRITIDIRVGRGGVATVYSASTSEGRHIALKIMSGACAEIPELRQRFRNEVLLAQHLAGHPRVATPYEMGELPELEGRPYLAMPFIRGRPLPLAIGLLDVAAKVAIARDLALVVADVHDHGIIHRDIKPGNVIVQERGDEWVPYLLDFGMAHSRGEGSAPATVGLTAAHELPGTKHYMAPEQILGAAPGASFDVYSIGVTLYELLAGVCPLDELSPHQAAQYKCDPNNPPLSIMSRRLLDLPQGLVRIVDAALARDPRERTSSARELADQLTRVLDELRDAPTSPAHHEVEHAGAVTPPVAEDADRDRASGHELRAADPAPATEQAPRRRLVAVVGGVVLLFALVLTVILLPGRASNVAAGEERGEPPGPAASTSTQPAQEAHVAAGSTSQAPLATTSDAPQAASTMGSEDTDAEPVPAPAQEPEPSPQLAPKARPQARPPITKGPACSDVVAKARAASSEREWERVLRFTKSGRCWESEAERVQLRTEALSGVWRYAECIALGRSSEKREILRIVNNCQRKLDKDGHAP